MFIVILVIYTVTVYIYRIAFYDKNTFGWNVFEYIVDFFFFLDCVFTFFTCYYESYSQLVVSRKLIALKYLKSWLFLDVLGFFPVDIFTDPDAGVKNPFDPNLMPLDRTFRILKLSRIFKC